MRALGGLSRFVAVLVTVVSAGVLTGSTPNVDGFDVPEPPSDPNTLVLQLHLWRSMSGPPALAELPEFSLYGGGRVIVGNGWDGSLHRAREFTLNPERYWQIYRLAHAAGLATTRHLPEPGETTDGTMLVAELRSAGHLHTTTVISLGRTSEVGPRRRIAEFRRTVRQLAVATEPARTTDYRPDLVAVLATAGWHGGVSRTAEWQRTDSDLLAGVRTDLGECTTRGGAALPGIEALGRGTPLGTRWLSRAERSGFVVLVRPLLPDEEGCADLNLRRERK
ncbi:hypothetical protein ACGFJ5_12025 [Micromonospora echinaurantiaca]|uniref:hypothetical protein n=1 Tax=Micromonospora echinaurantiaca TaxID=47857 RepID=UPI003721276F